MMRKFSCLSLFLVLTLCLSSCLFPLPEGWEQRLTLPSFRTTTIPLSPEAPPATPPAYVPDENSYGYYYDQLEEAAKTVYRAIYLNAKDAADIPIGLPEALEITVANEAADAEVSGAVQSAVRAIVQPAMDALSYDHPELDWIAMGGEGGSTFGISSHPDDNGDGTLTYSIPSLTFHLKLVEGLADAAAVATHESALQAAIESATVTGTTRYERLKSAHDWLCEQVVYTSDAPRAHEAAGALLDGQAVCDGYAKAFKLICDELEIPCIIVAGTAYQNGSEELHAWNYVCMENGKWYGVDATWDDGTGGITASYFLVGSLTVPSATHGSFSHSHRPNGNFSSGDYTPFVFPMLEGRKYDPLFS